MRNSQQAGKAPRHLTERAPSSTSGRESSGPFCQGQLDVFCAIYAVINGLQLTHGLRAQTARDLLHDSLREMAIDPDIWQQYLEQQREYHQLVDHMLNRERRHFPLIIREPFAQSREDVPVGQLWDTLETWFREPRRAAVVRFVRPLPLPGMPTIRHWTTVRAANHDSLTLFDCSPEKYALQALNRQDCVTDTETLYPGLIYLDPTSVRLLGVRYAD